ncbi:unnamed protein product [Linum tenue]|uniref:Bifunctional inhibitor/plant lipid transfer protein/seed storage helical domain-containing protein n=1 Tax=Linum tenue TaxID=586396 RepID=A0AAV0N1J4_9ROSI|nr:unnamed protein product [Linum tenue]
MFRHLPAAAAAFLVIISAVSAQTMSPGPAPYYSPTAPSMSPPSSSGGGGVAPAPAVDCMTQLFNLSDCLSYVTTGSNLTKPDKPCCPELAGLVDSNPICLCTLLTLNASDYGFDIDRTRAFGLPSVCSVSTPPVSLCPAMGPKWQLARWLGDGWTWRKPDGGAIAEPGRRRRRSHRGLTCRRTDDGTFAVERRERRHGNWTVRPWLTNSQSRTFHTFTIHHHNFVPPTFHVLLPQQLMMMTFRLQPA